MTNDEPLTFQTDSNGMAVVVCPQCNCGKRINVGGHIGPDQIVRFRCACNKSFRCRFLPSPEVPATPDPLEMPQDLSRTVHLDGPMTIHTDSGGNAVMTCPNCGSQKKVNALRYKGEDRLFTIRCSCGMNFQCAFEFPPDITAVLPPLEETPQSPGDPLIFVADASGSAPITCPVCGTEKIINAARFKKKSPTFTITCGCGTTFKSRIVHEKDVVQQPKPVVREAIVEEPKTVESFTAVRVNPKPVELETIRPIDPSESGSEPVSEPILEAAEESAFKPVSESASGPAASRSGIQFGKSGTVKKEQIQGITGPQPPSPDAKVNVFFANKGGQATIICPTCGQDSEMDVEHPFFNFTCRCGEVFACRIEYRKVYRKKTDLEGSYVNERNGYEGDMLVKDVSLGGVGLLMRPHHGTREGDTLEIDFLLDDPLETHIKRRVKVKSVRDRFVGAQFLGYSELDRELGCYLLP